MHVVLAGSSLPPTADGSSILFANDTCWLAAFTFIGSILSVGVFLLVGLCVMCDMWIKICVWENSGPGAGSAHRAHAWIGKRHSKGWNFHCGSDLLISMTYYNFGCTNMEKLDETWLYGIVERGPCMVSLFLFSNTCSPGPYRSCTDPAPIQQGPGLARCCAEAKFVYKGLFSSTLGLRLLLCTMKA